MKEIKKMLVSLLFTLCLLGISSTAITTANPAQAATKEYKAKVAKAKKMQKKDQKNLSLNVSKIAFDRIGQVKTVKLRNSKALSYRGWRLEKVTTSNKKEVTIYGKIKVGSNISFKVKAKKITAKSVVLTAKFRNKYTDKRKNAKVKATVNIEPKDDNSNSDGNGSGNSNDNSNNGNSDGNNENGNNGNENNGSGNSNENNNNGNGSGNGGNVNVSGGNGSGGSNNVPPTVKPPTINTKPSTPSNPSGTPEKPPVVNPSDPLPPVDPSPNPNPGQPGTPENPNPGGSEQPGVTTPPAIIVTPPAIELIEIDRSNWRVIDGSSVYNGKEHASSLEGVQSNIVVTRQILDANGNEVAAAINAGVYTAVFHFEVPEGYKAVEPLQASFEITKRNPAVQLLYNEATKTVSTTSEIVATDISSANLSVDGQKAASTEVNLGTIAQGQHKIAADFEVTSETADNYLGDLSVEDIYSVSYENTWGRVELIAEGNQVKMYLADLHVPVMDYYKDPGASALLYVRFTLESNTQLTNISTKASNWNNHSKGSTVTLEYDLLKDKDSLSSAGRYYLGSFEAENISGAYVKINNVSFEINLSNKMPYTFNEGDNCIYLGADATNDAVIENNSLNATFRNDKDLLWYAEAKDPQTAKENLTDYVKNNISDKISISVDE